MCVAASAVAEHAAKDVRKNAKQKNKAFAKQGTDSIIAAHFERRMGRYPSGQRGQTVNLLAYAYAGSNPALPTIFILSELKTKAPPQRRGFFFHHCHSTATFEANPPLKLKAERRPWSPSPQTHGSYTLSFVFVSSVQGWLSQF